jgi:uncharacterized repeat protein (TIGR01451 family)
MKTIAALVTAGSLLASTATAQSAKQGVEVSVQVLTEKEVEDTSGNKIFERQPVDVATPEQEVIYKITVHNGAREAASNVALNIPVSKSLLIKPASFTSDIDMNVSFSLDGENFDPMSSLHAVNDKTAPQATAADIEVVRIDIPEIPLGETYFIEYDAIVR